MTLTPRKISVLDGADLAAGLAYYRVTHGRFARQTRTSETSVARLIKTRRGSNDVIPHWVDCVLFLYENHPDLRGMSDPIQLILAEWNVDLYPWITGTLVANALDLYGVSVDVFASDLGRDVRAVRDYLNEAKSPIPGWMVWVLLMYGYHPELRGGADLVLPIDRWKESLKRRKRWYESKPDPTG